jgi:hypothetical protein
VRFASPDRARENQILGRGDPLAAREGVNLCRAHAVGGGEIKCIERLRLRKACLAESLPDHRLVSRGLLGAQDLVEILFMRPVCVARLAGEAFKDARDPGHLQRACLRDDEIAGDDGRRHTRAPVNHPS